MNIVQIAKLAGVSPATVSRVFNRPGQVNPETLERILDTARRHGYHPNPAAQTLRTQRSRLLGVMLPTFGNPVFAECLEGIADYAGEHGFGIMPVTSDYHPQREQLAIERLIARGVDAMVMVLRNPDESGALQDLTIPFVLAYNQHERFKCVGVDGQAEVAKVVERLAALGHRRIAMVSGALIASDRARQRYRGYLQGLQACAIAPLDLIEVDFIRSEMPALARVLTQPETQRPSALICSNDLLALRAIRLAGDLGLTVPGQLSVVGFDGIAIGSEISPVLSTVIQPNKAIGYQAARLVIEQVLAPDSEESGTDNRDRTPALVATRTTRTPTSQTMEKAACRADSAHKIGNSQSALMHTLSCTWREGETAAPPPT